MKIKIQHSDFDINKEIQLLKNNNNIGAIVSFIGFVRDIIGDKDSIEKIILEYYPKMSKKALQEIADKAKNRWKLSGITIIHRVGSLYVNDQIVLVIISSKHRKDAFNSCEFIMDYLKTDAPFWKKEYKKSGSSKWILANDKDHKSKKKWTII